MLRSSVIGGKDTLFPDGMQIVGEFPHGAGAVREGVLLVGGHLGEGVVGAFGTEERVVTEPFVSGLVFDDAPLDPSFEEVFLAAEDQRDDRAEAGPAVFRALEVAEQQAVVGGEVVAVGGVARRVYAGGSAERLDLEARVVGEAFPSRVGCSSGISSVMPQSRGVRSVKPSPRTACTSRSLWALLVAKMIFMACDAFS